MNAAGFDKAMIDLGLKSDEPGRFWNKSETLGIYREDGVVSLLDTDGCPANEVTNLDFAVYAASKVFANNDDPDGQWNYMIEANREESSLEN